MRTESVVAPRSAWRYHALASFIRLELRCTHADKVYVEVFRLSADLLVVFA